MNARAIRYATNLAVLGGVATLAWLLLAERGRAARPLHVDLAFTAVAEQPIDGAEHLAHDPHAGQRPRRGARVEQVLTPLGGGAPQTVVATIDEHGLHGAAPRGAELGGPRVLLLGDDLVAFGAPTEARISALAQRALRDDPTTPAATVLDASCDGYGLLEIALRAPELVARYRPELLVACANLGDDLGQLVDPRRARIVGGAVVPPAPTQDVPVPLTARWLTGRLPGCPLELARRALAWRGLLDLQPALQASLARQLDETIELLQRAAPARAGLLVVLLPSAADLAPDAVRAEAGELAAELLRPELGQQTAAAVTAALQRAGTAFLDATPLLRPLGPHAFWRDGRLTPAAHAALATPLADRIAARLRAF
ncbi:MAG: hypothetical protein IPM29_12065 [Planctomycetes bacterium]|nr:hypothetical protein [Planctomycetota bacterium]